MCDANLTLGLATAGAGLVVSAFERQRRDANKVARQQSAATTAAIDAMKKGGGGAITPSLPEPVKDPTVQMDAARENTSRQQMMRRGLMSTFTRYDRPGRASTAAPNLSGKSKTLGG